MTLIKSTDIFRSHVLLLTQLTNNVFKITFDLVCFSRLQLRVSNDNIPSYVLGVRIYRTSVVEWLALLLRSQEVPGSNLGPGTGYPD
jgi:hypothetical protein